MKDNLILLFLSMGMFFMVSCIVSCVVARKVGHAADRMANMADVTSDTVTNQARVNTMWLWQIQQQSNQMISDIRLLAQKLTDAGVKVLGALVTLIGVLVLYFKSRTKHWDSKIAALRTGSTRKVK